jgi:hypothetical protein
MATPIAQALAALLLLGLLASSALAQEQPPAAYQAAAIEARIPAVVLFAVALQESGIKWRGRLIPWPWTLNVAGNAYRFQTKREACAALSAALHTSPKTRIDVGLGQINLGYHRHRVDKPCDLLDPYRNLAICASILREHHRESDDWLVAVGRYHRPAGGAPAARYRQGVEQHLARLTASRNASSFANGDVP